MAITPDTDILASDFINRSEKNATPVNDLGKVAKLESDAKIHHDFIRGKTVVTMTANQDLTAGNTVGVSNGISDYVAKSFVATYNTLPKRNNLTYSSLAMQLCDVYWMTGDQFVIVYRLYGSGSGFSSQQVWALAGTINRTTMTITWGSGTLMSEDTSGSMNGSWGNICKVDTNKFVFVCTVYTTKYCYVGTISGNTITMTSTNAPSGLSTQAYDWFSGAQLGTNSGVFFMTNATSTNSRLCSFTVSGTTVTWGTTLTFSSLVTGNKICKVSATSFAGVTTAGMVYVGTISGGVITMGTGVAIGSDASSAGKGLEYMSDGVILFSYGKNTTNTNFAMRSITISGTVPTGGTEIVIGIGAQVSYTKVVSKTSTTALVIANNKIYDVTISGSTISSYPLKTKVLGGNITVGYLDFIYLNGYYAIIPYTLANYTTSYFIEGMANNFIGIAQQTVSKNASVDVLIRGVDETQTGLTGGALYMPSGGSFYYIDDDSLINSADDLTVVRAISSTKVIL